MRVRVVAFGKLKTPGLREAADYYRKLLGTWIPLTEVELKPLPVPPAKSGGARLQIQAKEAELLLDRIASGPSGRTAFYLLDEGGKTLDTLKWAESVRGWESDGAVEDLVFCIGSSLGFSPEVRKRARGAFSFGPQTLSHELARVVLLEQLYRAWSVTRGHPYHNEGS